MMGMMQRAKMTMPAMIRIRVVIEDRPGEDFAS